MATPVSDDAKPPLDEARAERIRRQVGLWLAPIVFFGLLLAPLGLEPAAHRLLAVVALVVVLWVSEAVPLPVTALLGPCLAVVLGVAPARSAFLPFSDPVIYLFLGSFLLADALQTHGLDQRIALRVLALPAAAHSPAGACGALALAAAGLSMWISNTATAAMLLPVALGIVRAFQRAGVDASPRRFLLVLAYAASTGGVATPVGTPPNLITLGFLDRLAGRDIGFLQFMAVGVPLALLLTAAVFVVAHMRLGATAGVTGGVREFVVRERAALGPWSAGQKACATAFALAVVLWLAPGVAALAGVPAGSPLSAVVRLEEAVVALLAALVLFFWPVGNTRALTWAAAGRVDWGTLILFGGGLSLGKLMFDTGLARLLGDLVLEGTGVESLWGLTALAIVLAMVLTELTSNTAAISMLAPIVIAAAAELGVSPVPPTLGACFGASMAFMLPVATPPNAIVYGTGQVPLGYMIRAGIVMDLISFVLILGALRFLCPLVGLV